MKQTRIIRISFLICAALAVIAFWSGFYFGKNSAEPLEYLTASDKTPVYGASETKTADAKEESVESMKGITEQEQYYIRDGGGEYLTVYHSATDSIYFETDLKLSDLPDDLQKEAAEGIPFHDIDELYDFLENYSS